MDYAGICEENAFSSEFKVQTFYYNRIFKQVDSAYLRWISLNPVCTTLKYSELISAN